MKSKPFKVFSVGEDRLVESICQNLVFGDKIPGQLKIDIFSDEEMSPQFKESIRGKTVFIACSTTNPVKILQLELSIDAAMRASAKEIIAVIPYYGYARQDRKEGARGPIGGKVLANKITRAGAHRVITMDLHADQIQGFFDLPVDHINGRTVFRPYIEMMTHSDNYAIFSPDAGGAKRAEKMYSSVRRINPETTYGICHKKRDKPNSIEEMLVLGDVKGKKVILVDDICDTAGTLCMAAEIIMGKGAESVEAWITHFIGSGPAKERIEGTAALSKLVVTDSIYHTSLPAKTMVIPSGPTIAKFIDRIVTKQSIDDLNS